jgi:hypothetical protein
VKLMASTATTASLSSMKSPSWLSPHHRLLDDFRLS